jgi:geranylgeranyl diphosphate synthase type II
VNTAKYLDDCREKVDRALEGSMPKEGSHPARLVSAMRYSLFAGGKRIRPILVLAAAEAAGGSHEEALEAACAVELVHTYSLIHDDLPAMDDDDYRRGMATCHRAFDEGTAILAGDALLTMAFDFLSGEGSGIEDHLRLRQGLRLEGHGWGAAGGHGQ